MATSFPTSLDALTNPTSSDSLNTPGVLHADEHADANDAIEALEAKVGVNGSAVSTSLDYWKTHGPFAPTATGATAATRYVGGTASGAPGSGTFVLGDYVIDQTGKVWICTTGGTPGTWTQGGGADATKVPLTQTAATGVDVSVFKIQPDVVARGPFGFTVGDSLFNSTRDFVGYFGYNAANGGGRYLSTEHSFAWVHESDYEVGAGTHWAESYTEYRNKTGTFSFRPWFIVLDKATDIIQQHSFYGTPFSWLTQAGVQVANLDSDGVFQTYSPAGIDPLLRVNASSGRNPQLAGYSGTVARWLIQGTADYQATLSVNGGMIACFQYISGQHCLSIGSTDTVGSFYVKGPHAASNVMAAAQFSSGQTAPLLCLYNHDRSVVFGGFNRNGYLSVQKTAAPSDAELAAGELALWFDSTNGAAKVKWKAKEAGGTVRTGEVALA